MSQALLNRVKILEEQVEELTGLVVDLVSKKPPKAVTPKGKALPPSFAE